MPDLAHPTLYDLVGIAIIGLFGFVVAAWVVEGAVDWWEERG